MVTNLNIHMKNTDSITVSIPKSKDDGDFICLEIERSVLNIYFEGYGFEGYKNACRILDRMKMAVQEAWDEKNKGGKNGGE